MPSLGNDYKAIFDDLKRAIEKLVAARLENRLEVDTFATCVTAITLLISLLRTTPEAVTKTHLDILLAELKQHMHAIPESPWTH
jgi:hypothetical protein